MIELIRNCSHGSEIATYLEQSAGAEKTILKASTTAPGIKNLKRELAGWEWYQGIRYAQKKEPLCRIVQAREGYLKIQIEYIEGSRPDYRRGLSNNAGAVERVIRHYSELWPCLLGNKAPLHGDLSLDNVICNTEGVHLIDWEHFMPQGAPWGFDALYFLFEALWFGMGNRMRLAEREAEIIMRSIRGLNNSRYLEDVILRQPLSFVRHFMIENSAFWDEQFARFPDKFPVFNFSDSQVLLIDNTVKGRL